MVEPADVRGVPYGVAGEPEADDMVDRLPVVRQPDIGQPRRQIRRPLPTEPVLGCPDHRGVVPRCAQRRRQPIGDDEVPALGEERIRRDDRYTSHRMRLNVSARRTFADTVDVDGEDVLGRRVALCRGVPRSVCGCRPQP